MIYETKGKITIERPQIEINGKLYEVDNRQKTFMKLTKALQENADVETIIEMTLGKAAAKEIDELELSVIATQTIIKCILAAVQEITFEEADKMFHQ